MSPVLSSAYLLKLLSRVTLFSFYHHRVTHLLYLCAYLM